MAQIKQLQMIVSIRQEAENKAARMMQESKQALDMQQQQVQTLRDYRNDYLKKMISESAEGLTAQSYGHYHGFVTKLDDALGRAEQSVAVAQQVWQQRQQVWIDARADTKAIEMLIEREEMIIAQQTQRREQKQMDEFASMQFARRRST
ncbi:flagellar export protein FliJ [Echinimonas agarilytica]|uniref:Flagellar FliJ protein n=1 Tax=Echinimonas agarilytica TaxID=1215918 RepID=A0AA42B789_9GAMM|nr:flagellar export protein FliJ [Echinimonas agarilytica]MCM2678968.1 flagellar export protein FliJ [Echinimonas agarilytica]